MVQGLTFGSQGRITKRRLTCPELCVGGGSIEMSVSEHPLQSRQWLGKGGHRQLASDPSLAFSQNS